MTDKNSIAVLLSGQGSNLSSLIEARLPISIVVSDKASSVGIQIARNASLRCAVLEPAAFINSALHDASLADLLEVSDCRLVVLAGYMNILGRGFCQQYAGRAINLHPSLLPEFPGLNTHARALAAGCPEHGCSVHWLTAKVDAGPVIRSAKVAVLPDDDVTTLGARVKRLENSLLPEVVWDILTGRIQTS